MLTDFLQRLQAAAQKKGGPLTPAEKAECVKPQPTREEMRIRFTNVIRLAGYTGDGPDNICAEWLDKYMEDIPGFIAMCEQYENDYKRDGEII